jgi:hypothetical protein
MNWGGTGFSFGNLNPVQQGMYENSPDTAYQRLVDFFSGAGGQGWGDNTVFGRWLRAQQTPMYNRYSQQAAANPTGGLTWTSFLENQAPQLGAQFGSMPGYLRGANPGLFRTRRELY